VLSFGNQYSSVLIHPLLESGGVLSLMSKVDEKTFNT